MGLGRGQTSEEATAYGRRAENIKQRKKSMIMKAKRESFRKAVH